MSLDVRQAAATNRPVSDHAGPGAEVPIRVHAAQGGLPLASVMELCSAPWIAAANGLTKEDCARELCTQGSATLVLDWTNMERLLSWLSRAAPAAGASVNFSPALARDQRALVHAVAERHGVVTASHGVGAHRFVSAHGPTTAPTTAGELPQPSARALKTWHCARRDLDPRWRAMSLGEIVAVVDGPGVNALGAGPSAGAERLELRAALEAVVARADACFQLADLLARGHVAAAAALAARFPGPPPLAAVAAASSASALAEGAEQSPRREALVSPLAALAQGCARGHLDMGNVDPVEALANAWTWLSAEAGVHVNSRDARGATPLNVVDLQLTVLREATVTGSPPPPWRGAALARGRAVLLAAGATPAMPLLGGGGGSPPPAQGQTQDRRARGSPRAPPRDQGPSSEGGSSSAGTSSGGGDSSGGRPPPKVQVTSRLFQQIVEIQQDRMSFDKVRSTTRRRHRRLPGGAQGRGG